MSNPAAVIYEDFTSLAEIGKFIGGASNVELLASAARAATAGTNATPVVIGAGFGQAGFLLTLTDAEVDADDTLDVYVDCSLDGGATWVNIVHFTQILGNGANAQKYIALCPRPGVTDEFSVTSDVGAGATPRSLMGDRVRVRYVIVDPTGDTDYVVSSTNLTNSMNLTSFSNQPLTPTTLTVAITDTTPSITAGTLTINGTDQNDTVVSENFDLSGGLSFTSTQIFKTVTSVTTAGVTTLGGGGDETFIVGVTQNATFTFSVKAAFKR